LPERLNPVSKPGVALECAIDDWTLLNAAPPQPFMPRSVTLIAASPAAALDSSTSSLVAALGTLRVLYIQSPPEEGRRAVGFALPVWTRFSTAGAVVLCLTIAAYGMFGNPILGLAYQGAEALGLR